MAAHFCLPCKFIGEALFPEDRPSPIFSTFSVIINIVGAVWEVIRVSGGGCDSSTQLWASLGIINFIINIVFAVYIYWRFVHKIRESSGASEAAYKLFMYDWGVCAYFVFIVWLIVWMIVAGTRRNAAPSGDKCGSAIGAGITLIILYIAIGVALIFLTLFTECCREPKWKTRHVAHVSQQPAPQIIPAPGQTTGMVYAQPVVGGTPPPVNPAYAQPQQQRQGGGLFGNLFGKRQN